ncbi:MAG: diguanylate cyclase, partial [Thiohalobacterales bacterium]|nr:diguanylate cyclase [Thiohalobacterales bacterium]
MTKQVNLRLLVIEESRGDAESLANELRNSGHSIELAYAADLAALEAELARQVPDILICGSGVGLPDAAVVCALLDSCQLDIPVIAILDEAPEDKVVSARRAGITAVVSYERPDHLHVVFAHEARIIAMRHRLNSFTDRLLASEQRAHALIENSSDAIAYIHDGMHVYANRPYLDLFDIKSQEDIEGMPVLDMISSDQREQFRDFLKSHISDGGQERTLTIDCTSPRGETFNSTMEFTPASMDGEPCTQILIRVNSGANSELEKKIRTLSREDMLTGLWNRQYFMQLLEEQIRSASAAERQQALVYLTLDNFKQIREEAGIATSDLVLCDIANQLERRRGEHDLLARFGDYSFAMLKQDRDMETIQADCERLLKDIAGHLSEIEGRAFTMTASIGICRINRYRHNAQKAISYADMACEVARTSGGNQIHIHSNVVEESIGASMDENAEWIVQDTIDNDRFYLVFQPIISLKGDRTGQYEVLLRITDAQGHIILPGQLLSIAERTGHAPAIDRWVI